MLEGERTKNVLLPEVLATSGSVIVVTALRKALLDLSQEKFGQVPPTAVEQVEAISSREELEQLLRKVIHANSFSEIGLDGTKR